VQLKESYVAVRDGEAWLLNAHISPYSHGNRNNHDPLRTRKLLLHPERDREIGAGCDGPGNDFDSHEGLHEEWPGKTGSWGCTG